MDPVKGRVNEAGEWRGRAIGADCARVRPVRP